MSVDVTSATNRMVEAAQEELRFSCSLMAARLAPECESNIELMLLMAFDMMNMFYVGDYGRKSTQIVERGVAPDLSAALMTIEPQFKWDKYRIDFRVQYLGLEEPIFIECDGHDFHERTKEQAERDRSKDRAIQEAGIPILRFTGREIYRDPFGCATQVMKFALTRIRAKNK